MEDYTTSPLRNEVSQNAATDSVDLCKLSTREFTRYVFVDVPSHWIASTLDARGLPTAMPMCSTLFLVRDPWIARQIESHVQYFSFPEDDDRHRLSESGWQVIPETGLFAFQLDGEWLLGIDGIGYDFHEAHWRTLHERLRQSWQYDD